MKKIFLIMSREYLVRVRKRTFILMTFLSPLLFAALFVIPVFLATGLETQKVVEVWDENGVFAKNLKEEKKLKFVPSKAKSLQEAIANLKDEKNKNAYYALLFIPKIELDRPKGIEIFANRSISIDIEGDITRRVEDAIESVKLEKSGIDRATLDKLKTDVNIRTRKASGEDSSTGLAFAIGFGAAFLIYLSVFLYGAQVMMGVIEEKSSRVIEVMISSVKPFELMMGKILGIAMIGLTQFILWIILTFGIVTGAGYFIDTQEIAQKRMEQSMKDNPEAQRQIKKQTEQAGNIFSQFNKLPITKIVLCFLFYFAGGYLMYSALFAAAASAVENQSDAQQFTLPISMPLIIAFVIAQISVTRDPDGIVAFWGSMIPLTSPIVMMVRLPFDVPTWQLALSMILLVFGFIFTTWIAARIYRVGILMYGKKVNFKELGKWLFYKM